MKISIVTPSYNQADFLAQTIPSILSQQGGFELELIVVDGGSTDHSVAVLRGIDDPRLRWTSEKDEGQSDAINKGFAQATGDVLAWLNSDDLYVPGALQQVADAFGQAPEAAWLTGYCPIIDAQSRPIRGFVSRYKNKQLGRYTYGRLLRENFISQPATFWRAAAWARTGPLDTGLHWTMDYDLWLRLGKVSDPVVLPHPLAQFRLYETSKTGSFDRAQYDEGYAVAQRYGEGARSDLRWHKFNVEKIVSAYRVLKVLGR